MTLRSAHVDPEVLASIASEYENLFTTSDGAIYTLTADDGSYGFHHLPLGSYRLTASKVEENGIVHEFENPVQTVELPLESPNKYGVLYTDLSVFPVSGRIIYSLKKFGKQDVFVKDVVVVAQPAGNASPMEALPSEKYADATGTNYNLPLFAGKYLFIARLGGHDIHLSENCTGYDKGSKLVTIKNAVTDIDFIDYTTREVFVYVEDSGGHPIDIYKDNKILVQVNGDNGFAEGELTVENKAYFKAVVPPGEYTISLPNVPTAYVKGKPAERNAKVDVRAQDDDTATMVVPVPIELEIGPEPTLLSPDQYSEFCEKIGLCDDVAASGNPEGYMIYYPPAIQTHVYTIKATANGNPVGDVTLRVTDDISQLSQNPASEKTYPNPTDARYETANDGSGLYTIAAGLPKASVVNPDDPSTYLKYTLADGQTVVKVPIVLPKGIKFQASKEGYEDSALYTEEVTVLGDMSQGSESALVAIPNVNYFVLHDPPGDASYSYLDDSMTFKGIIADMQITAGDAEIAVYPSPWSEERDIDGVNYKSVTESNQDLGNKGLLGNHYAGSASIAFAAAAVIEAGTGAGITITGPAGYGIAAAKIAATMAVLETGVVQYEISPARHLETASGDELPDLMGPGNGDIYYGEGWTLALQTKYRLGIKKNPDYDEQDPDSKEWIPDTAQILAYDIMERNNQYIYTIRDIEERIADLELQIADIGDPGTDESKKQEKQKLLDGVATWKSLLNGNPAYVWQRDHVNNDEGDASRSSLEEFMESNGYDKDAGELLVFSAGSTFEYSRSIGEGHIKQFSTSIGIATTVGMKMEGGTGPWGAGGGIAGPIIQGQPMSIGYDNTVAVSTGQSYGRSWDSGTETSQTVGFVLSDDDVGDNISTYVFAGPWGTPIFFTDPGSITSNPWQVGTNKAIDITIELVEEPTNTRPFDYHDGAHYRVQMNYTGVLHLLGGGSPGGAGIGFTVFVHPFANPSGLTTLFNGHEGSHTGRYRFELQKEYPTATIAVSLYPPANDQRNSNESEYSVVIQVESENDYQINRAITVTPRFADFRAPRATITAPYEGQRISPKVFTGDEKFLIQAYSDDYDLAKVQVEIRSKKTDGVWEPWRPLSGIVWADPTVHDDADNSKVTIVPYENRDPVRREFTFKWGGDEISGLGAGEYAFRAVAEDEATRFVGGDSQDQVLTPNVDLDAPVVSFQIDGSKPTVLTTVPFYQDKESERIYRGELTATFNDDMRAGDFSDRTFEVTDLLDNKVRVAGFVSYSPALRKALFVPVVPLKPNGFYFVTIKTDIIDDLGNLESGVHDLAGNPLDNEFIFTFRTRDTPFEETWSIVLSAEDVNSDAYQAVGQMQSWDGHWLETKADNLTLTIPAPGGLGSFVPPLPESYKPPMAPPVAPATHNTQLASYEFDLRFELTSDFASDRITTLGTRQNAKVGFDSFDASEPPILDGTVAAYFNHEDRQTEPGLYNTDYQPSLKVGETRTWKLLVFTNKPKANMRLSWRKTIDQTPPDTMLYFRQAGSESSEWMDMRKIQFIELEAKGLITKEPFEIRAERFALELPEALSVVAGEKQVKMSWAATENPFITGYTITRNGFDTQATQPKPQYEIPSTEHEFIDTAVEEEATYIYQISVHFKTGAELKSKPFTVTVLPGIEKTVLLQNYPNPFNPDTWIPYELDSESDVTIDIYNVKGHLIKTIHLGNQPRGRYVSKDKSVRWNGRTDLGERAANGVYFYIMRAGKFTATRKMVILK